MPYLDLTPEMVGPQRTPLVLSYLENLMLWPDDEQKRARAIEAGKGQFMLDNIKAWPAQADALKLPIVADLFQEALAKPPLAQVREDAETPHLHGMIAGWIPVQYLIRSEVEGSYVKLEDLKDEIVGYLKQRLNMQRGISVFTINTTILPRYRPVQHLWAAHVARLDPSTTEYIFPCPLPDLPDFLALAEAIRVKAEGTAPHRQSVKSGGALLPPGVALAVPPSIPLPEVTLKWRQGVVPDDYKRA
ncbi:hypothetical protein [Rhodospirillaceae bacterium SYSU D60014]|uniref:hypothetical protein n=1 Tax=Virgifigura deserti TaxID=2268457 RepID=UPI000E66848E